MEKDRERAENTGAETSLQSPAKPKRRGRRLSFVLSFLEWVAFVAPL